MDRLVLLRCIRDVATLRPHSMSFVVIYLFLRLSPSLSFKQISVVLSVSHWIQLSQTVVCSPRPVFNRCV